MKKVTHKNIDVIFKDVNKRFEKINDNIEILEENLKKTEIEDIRKKRLENWIYGKGICEFCGHRKATVNLDLKSGTHRECRTCWDFW